MVSKEEGGYRVDSDLLQEKTVVLPMYKIKSGLQESGRVRLSVTDTYDSYRSPSNFFSSHWSFST
jgi:hypothetical protein